MPWTIKHRALPVLLLASAGSAALGHAMPAPMQAAAAAEALPPDLPQGDGPRATSSAQSSRYDEVGYASVDGEDRGDAITASQTALPRGSFAEVTDLDSGKTILLQIADSGPGRRDQLIVLSSNAARLLGVSRGGHIPVRVRQVDPAPADQAALMQGRSAAMRLDSPPILLAGLRARLPGAAPTMPPTAPAIVATPTAPPPPTHLRTPAPATKAPPAAEKLIAAPKVSPAAGRFFVQVAALSTEARAQGLARRLGGSVRMAGRFWQVRLGPYADTAAAQHARDGAAAHGYGDARVVHDD